MESFIIGFTMFTTLVWLINQQLVDDFYALDERLRKTYTNHHLLKPCLPLGVTTHLSVYRSLWLGWLINLVYHIHLHEGLTASRLKDWRSRSKS